MRPRRIALFLPILLLFAGCFEEPVRDELTIRFLPRDADGDTAAAPEEAPDQPDQPGQLCEIELVTRIQSGQGHGDNPTLEARVDERRREILSGEDAWALRFIGLDAPSRHASFDWKSGSLREAHQVARIDLADHPDALTRFFGDTLISADYQAEDGWAELSLAPLAAGRATRRQRQIYDRSVGPWTGALATYFRAASALYTYLASHPDRARVTLGVLLADVLDGEDEDALRHQLLAHEKPLVDAVDDAMDKAEEVLVIDDDEAYSINEISRLLYDPFPAHIRVVPGGRVLETEGFTPGGPRGDGALEIPGFSLWEALESLQGKWLSPDPLLLYVRLSGGLTGAPAPELTLDQIAARDRVAAQPPPRAEEIRAAIERRLEPEPLYRVAWETPR